MTIKKNEQYTVEFIDLTHEGLGVCKIDNFPIFVENALPQEQATIKIIKVGKNFGYGRIVEHLTTSPNRVAIKDEKGTWVGTMPLQHMTYDTQLVFKQQQVQNVMNKVAQLPQVPVYSTLGATQQIGYRNKAQIPVGQQDGELITGFYRKNSHTLIPMDDFIIQDPEIDQAIITLRQILQQHDIVAYNEAHHSGQLRHIVVRKGVATQQLQIVLVTRQQKLPAMKIIVDSIIQQIPNVVSIVQNINTKRTNVIMGEITKVLYGKDSIKDKLLGYTFNISSQSFYQVNPAQTEVLYQEAIKAAQLKSTDVVIDAYCGIGTIGICLANQVKHVYGVEVVESAIQMARDNAKLNQLTNLTFEVGKAETLMSQWIKAGIKPNVIIVDPPRKGLDSTFIEAAVNVKPRSIVYVSCNPATLARDLKLFASKGYETKYIQPVDMFPQTVHVECVALIEKK